MSKAKSVEKVRVYALAKELELNSKEMLEKLQALGYEVKSIQSTLSRADADQAVKAMSKKKAKKTTTKKAVAKKITKKVTAKKTEPKKAEPKKATAKKATTKKTEPKKTATKKAEPKKTAKKTTAKKSEAKKPVAKKTESKKATGEKAESKKATAKKTESKKATAKKSEAKKAESKKTTKKAESKKVTAKKTESKKASSKAKAPVSEASVDVEEAIAEALSGELNDSRRAEAKEFAEGFVKKALSLLGVNAEISVTERSETESELSVVSQELKDLPDYKTILNQLVYFVGKSVHYKFNVNMHYILRISLTNEASDALSFENVALQLAEKMNATGRVIYIDALSSSERRMMHAAISGSDEVEAGHVSDGEGIFRRLIIASKSITIPEAVEERGRNDRSRGPRHSDRNNNRGNFRDRNNSRGGDRRNNNRR